MVQVTPVSDYPTFSLRVLVYDLTLALLIVLSLLFQVISDGSRFVKLDWDILGAALESIGGLDPTNPTSVEVVSAEGESQQIIIQASF